MEYVVKKDNTIKMVYVLIYLLQKIVCNIEIWIQDNVINVKMDIIVIVYIINVVF